MSVLADSTPTATDQSIPCENCGCSNLTTFKVSDTNQFWVCADCQLYQKQIRPKYDYYEDEYHSKYAARRESKIRTGMTRLGATTRYLSNSHDHPPTMLDIGCSIGATVEAGRRMGWDAKGVDISQAAVNFCCEQGLDCQKINDYRLPFEDGAFDVVTSWHVIEHVDDVKVTLAEWFRVVKPGGILVLETPDSQCLKAKRLGAKYTSFWPIDHLYTFSRSNMCTLLENTGFKILPSRILGRLNALPPHITMYASAYRTIRQTYRRFGWCKSIEVCCRKP